MVFRGPVFMAFVGYSCSQKPRTLVPTKCIYQRLLNIYLCNRTCNQWNYPQIWPHWIKMIPKKCPRRAFKIVSLYAWPLKIAEVYLHILFFTLTKWYHTGLFNELKAVWPLLLFPISVVSSYFLNIYHAFIN